MTSTPWLIYGAAGYTGRLIAEAALRRGHQPILAGRSAAKLRPLAERLGLAMRIAELGDPAGLDRLLDEVGLVLHAAGPFVHTSAPMVAACLRAGVHYLDITGEVPVFERIFEQDAAARAAGVALLPGAGFDVVPSDCLARYVAQRLPGATELEIAVSGTGGVSAGTARSAIEQAPRGALVRRNGRLVPQRLGAETRRVSFTDGRRVLLRAALAATWGDLATAYRSTGIPNITTYLGFPDRVINTARWAGPALQVALQAAPVRRLALACVGRTGRGPDQARRERGRGFIWARAATPGGAKCQAWLVTPETYLFTALAAVRCVERVREAQPAGALTPAQAFGADFALEISGVQRFDALP
jgi:short subunit dehydrogenase-like uncharacterized protein